MPAPALSGLAAARPPPTSLRSRPDPRARGAAGLASHPPGGRRRGAASFGGVRPPRDSPAVFCFLVTSSLRTGLCRTGRSGSSSHSSPLDQTRSRKAPLCRARSRRRHGASPAHPRWDEWRWSRGRLGLCSRCCLRGGGLPLALRMRVPLCPTPGSTRCVFVFRAWRRGRGKKPAPAWRRSRGCGGCGDTPPIRPVPA